MGVVLKVPAMSWLACLADMLMLPLMYLISGTFREKPQGGHVWNKHRVALEKTKELDCLMTVVLPQQRLGTSSSRFFIHLPIISMWKDYVVLEPTERVQTWFVGWILPGRAAVRKIKLSGPVRMLYGSDEVSFFGINENGYQIPLQVIGKGKIGDGGPFKDLPLL